MEETGIRYVGIDLAKRSFEVNVSFPDEQKVERFSGATSTAGVEKLNCPA